MLMDKCQGCSSRKLQPSIHFLSLHMFTSDCTKVRNATFFQKSKRPSQNSRRQTDDILQTHQNQAPLYDMQSSAPMCVPEPKYGKAELNSSVRYKNIKSKLDATIIILLLIISISSTCFGR